MWTLSSQAGSGGRTLVKNEFSTKACRLWEKFNSRPICRGNWPGEPDIRWIIPETKDRRGGIAEIDVERRN